jgi:hypothetical protein
MGEVFQAMTNSGLAGVRQVLVFLTARESRDGTIKNPAAAEWL